MKRDIYWSANCIQLTGYGFEKFHRALARYNRLRLEPSLPENLASGVTLLETAIRDAEIAYLNAVRAEIGLRPESVPKNPDDFIAWFESLRVSGPGQNDPLFPWLERNASLEQMKWFIEQEVSGEAGFDDLVALTQVKMPVGAKLEMARNYWDEMGRGSRKGMHGPMLEALADHLDVDPSPASVVPEALALGNAMMALANNRCFAYHSVGALGVIEMTAPTRAGHIARGLERLGVPAAKRHYFALHAVLDVKHSDAWNQEVLRTVVAEDPRCAHAMAEGALIRLWHGERCFIRYKEQFGLNQPALSRAVRRRQCVSWA